MRAQEGEQVKNTRGSEREFIAKGANGYIPATNGYFNLSTAKFSSANG